MIYICNENLSYFDCDETLIMHRETPDKPYDLQIVDPYIKDCIHYVRVHEIHVNLLKAHKARGKTIVVWSAAGAPWAKAVVETLKIQEHVDVIIAKPTSYIDDLPGNEILGTRIYLKED